MLWALCLGAALADTYALNLERSQAALWAGRPGEAVLQAEEALREAPHAFRAHRAWQKGMLAMGLEQEADARYQELAGRSLPQARWLGGWWLAWREGIALPEVEGLAPRTEAVWRGELLWLRGDSEEVLSILEGVDGPDAARLRLKALGARKETRVLAREARAMMARYPEYPDILGALWADDGRALRNARRRALAAGREALGGNAEALYRAHALFVRAGAKELAQETATALIEAGEPWQLGSHVPYNDAMVRDLGRVLSRQENPRVPEGCSPVETERVLVATARHHIRNGRSARAADLYRAAVAVGVVRSDLWLEIATFLEEEELAPPQEVLKLVEEARSAIEALPYNHAQLHRERLLSLWRLEAHAAARGGLGQRARVAREEAEAISLVVETGEEAAARPLVQVTPGIAPLLLKTTRGSVKVAQGGDGLVVLTIWASWCGPCQEELPELQEMSRRFAGEGLGVSVVAVSVDREKSDYERWVRRNRMPQLALTWYPEIQRRLRVDGIPVTFVLDGDGVIRERRQGYRPGDMDKLESRIRALLE